MKRERRERPGEKGNLGKAGEREGAFLPESLGTNDQKSLILSILISFFEDTDRDNLRSFVRHVGFDVGVASRPRDFFAAWLGHYRLRRGAYDVERACNDLATWPPIAARIAELDATESEV